MTEDISLTDTDIENGIVIEDLIVSNIKNKHEEYLKTLNY